MSEKPGEVTVVLSREEAAVLHDSRKQWGLRISETQKGARDKLEAALAAYDAAQNPLGLPWEPRAHASGAHPPGHWGVDTQLERAHVYRLTEAQARLMAAAPEMADALEMVSPCCTGGDAETFCTRCQARCAALKKAGRR